MEWLYTVTATELFLGGGGRLVEIGPITLRMLLFAVCLVATLKTMLDVHDRGWRLAAFLLIAYVFLHFPGVVIGIAKGADRGNVLTDLQPTFFWAAAPFLAGVLQSRRMIERTAKLVVVAGAVLAATYLLLVAGLLLGFIDITDLYTTLSVSGEFFYRGESFFFYKGFLYLTISCVFLTAIPRRWGTALLVLVGSALVLTVTRGFILSTGLATMLMLLTMRRWNALVVAGGLAAVALFAVFVFIPGTIVGAVELRGVSDSVRVDDLRYIVVNTGPLTFLVGEGLGLPINGRLAIENSYLWIFWKMGLPALLFWLVPLTLSWRYFRKIPRDSPDFKLGCAFFFGTLLVHIQTATNPYLNNPIGLSFVIIALFSLRTLAIENTDPASDPQAPLETPKTS